ncbi:MAG: GyrI-like domain-containing protein [Spirochaetes bacterium]|nr:GyrI-like domain-containing protein [Spirochaetota bacterium]MBU0956434.1 GyrI-like domain-containing protein [Spirochaetota bacterium]
MKHDWKKEEKSLYLPKTEPAFCTMPSLNYFMLDGEGDPNQEKFRNEVATLYTLSYAVKMSPKAGIVPIDYHEYSVYPLEGLWSLKNKNSHSNGSRLDKSQLLYTIMIRQPDFITSEFAQACIERTKHKKRELGSILETVRFGTIAEGSCVQCLHLGAYDNEPETFARMEAWSEQQNWQRKSKDHHEIYLTDARKTEPARMKTVLRFQVVERPQQC